MCIHAFSDLRLRIIRQKMARRIELSDEERDTVMALLSLEAERIALEWNRAQAERDATRSSLDLGELVSRGFAPV